MVTIDVRNWRTFTRDKGSLKVTDNSTSEILYEGDNDDAAEMIMDLAYRCAVYNQALDRKDKEIEELVSELAEYKSAGMLNKLILNAKKQGIVIDGSDYAELLNMLFDNGYDPFKNYDGDE